MDKSYIPVDLRLDEGRILVTGEMVNGAADSPIYTEAEVLEDAERLSTILQHRQELLERGSSENVISQGLAMDLYAVLEERLGILSDGTGVIVSEESQRLLGRLLVEFFSSVG